MDPLGFKGELPRINAGAATGLWLREWWGPSALTGRASFKAEEDPVPLQFEAKARG